MDPQQRYRDVPGHYRTGPASHLPDRPLIDLVTNQWRKETQETERLKSYEEDEYGQIISSSSRDHSSRFSWLQKPPKRSLKSLAIYIVLAMIIIMVWKYRKGPDEDEILDTSLGRQNSKGRQQGTNAKPDFSNMILMKFLDSKYVPGATHGSSKRLIVVGDVHGCKEELVNLMDKIQFDPSNDHLILAGDMIFKGPDSSGVIDYARSVGASCIRGNHEDKVLLSHASLHSKKVNLSTAAPQVAKPTEPSATPAATYGDKEHLKLAQQLSNDQIQWLKECPVILNVGLIANKDYVVVHGGLAPGIRLERQDPFQVMNMRSIDLKTMVPSALRHGEPWFKVWNHYQSTLARGVPRKTVVYGHDSKTGLTIKKYSKGLDSGCVNGGRLTALVINERGKERVHSVRCHNYRAILEQRQRIAESKTMPK